MSLSQGHMVAELEEVVEELTFTEYYQVPT